MTKPYPKTFDEFLKAVNQELANQTEGAVSNTNDLSDYLYYDAFEDQRDPAEVAEDALASDDLWSMLMM